MRETTLDEAIRLETSIAVKEYCNQHDMTLDDFLILAVKTLQEQENKSAVK